MPRMSMIRWGESATAHPMAPHSGASSLVAIVSRFGRWSRMAAGLASAVFILATAVSPPPAAATQLELKGERGLTAGPDALDCAAGYATGLTARTGAWFDALGVQCATFDSATGHLVPEGRTNQSGDGGGGSPQDRSCPADEAIEYIQFSMFEVLHFDDAGATPDEPDKVTLLDDIIFRCRPVTAAAPDYANDPNFLIKSDDAVSISGAHSRTPSVFGSDVNYGFSHNEICPNGEIAVGLRVVGRSGSARDAGGVLQLGMDCDAVPTLAPPSTPTPVAPPPVVPSDYAKGESIGIGLQTGYPAGSADCNSGEVMVGIGGGIQDGKISAVAPVCASGPMPTSSSRTGPFLGSSSGVGATCSSGAVYGARAAVANDDKRVIAFTLFCGTKLDPAATVGQATSIVQLTSVVCGPGKLATGLYGWYTDAASKILAGFGFDCTATATSAATSSGAGSAPPSAPASAFAGSWIVTVPGFPPYPMQLGDDGAGGIVGSYQLASGPGTITGGTISGTTVSFSWAQGGQTGKGNFTLSGGGLTGTFSFTGGASGSWTAVKGSAAGGGSSSSGSSPSGGSPPMTASTFTGHWNVTISGGQTFSMDLHKGGSTITGSYQLSNGPGSITKGKVTGSALNFRWSQNGFTGSGYFEPNGGGGLKGSFHFDNGGPSGTWTAVR